MSYRKVFIAVFFLLLLVGLYATTAVKSHPQTYTIKRTEKSFTPRSLEIKKGDTIRFENASTGDSWPASDSHPSHYLYPEFDSQQPLHPGEAWSFTFTKAGVWKYHDHLHETITGTISVVGAPGEALRNCIDASKSTIKAYCWEADVQEIIRAKGLIAVFDAFKEWYKDPLFRRNCHDVGHVIGVAAYEAYMKDKTVIGRPETANCGYGFYHGFIEEALRKKGEGGMHDIADYCSTLLTSPQFPTKISAINAVGACYHGLGHSVFDSLDGSLWGDASRMVKSGLETCERVLTTKESRISCSSGVFNSLANALSAHSYRLSFSTSDPFGVCREVRDIYYSSCAKEIGVGFYRNQKYDLARGIAMLRRIPDRAAFIETLGWLIDDEVRSTVGPLDTEKFVRTCTLLSHEDEWRACERGIVTGVIGLLQPPDSYVAINTFCTAFASSSPQARFCIAESVRRVSNFFGEDAARALCSQFATLNAPIKECASISR